MTIEASLNRAIERARSYLFSQFIPSDENDQPVDAEANSGLGYWVGELEADTTLEADYIIFLYFLDPESHRDKIQKLANYIKTRQAADGSWNIYHGGPGEISASVKAYFALKLSGLPVTDPSLERAREWILSAGGAAKVNSFTKIYLCYLGQVDWRACPAIPPEIVLFPRFFYFNLYEMSYWSRAIVVPLSILYAHQPRRDVPSEASIDELFLADDRPSSGNGDASDALPCPKLSRDPEPFTWKNLFLLVDRCLKILEKIPVKPLRNLALRRAEKWMVSRFKDSDGLGAIFPSMVNSVMAMRCLGYPDDHPLFIEALEQLQGLEIADGDKLRLQPCLSPVWDTALALNAILEAGADEDDPRISDAARWLVSKEARGSADWELRTPAARSIPNSGWYFQFKNEFYPDIDDSAAVLMALERASLEKVDGGEESIRRGIEWLLGLQSSDGGWAAFDSDINREVLTRVPFADHNAMLDPACADITGRILEMFGRFPSLREDPGVKRAIERGVKYLEKEQDPSGAWYGRWGVNYVYGTWQALKGLASVGVPLDGEMVRRGADWLKSVQNADHGWGETCLSYDEPETKGQGPSTASQSAWAVMGLIAAGEVDGPEVASGIEYLMRTQHEDGSWDEEDYTGTGFPKVFYLRYHLYCQYFPLFALGYYRRSVEGSAAACSGKNIQLGEAASPEPALVSK